MLPLFWALEVVRGKVTVPARKVLFGYCSDKSSPTIKLSGRQQRKESKAERREYVHVACILEAHRKSLFKDKRQVHFRNAKSQRVW